MDWSIWNIIAHCGAVIQDHGMTFAGLFFAGLVGGATHCTGMCGPFVLSQTGTRLGDVPLEGMNVARRMHASLLLPYHLGRITTYALLGAIVSVPVGLMVTVGKFWWLGPAMLTTAAMVFLLMALGQMRGATVSRIIGNAFGGPITRTSKPLFLQPYGMKGYGLGLMLGMLPCGLVYAAIAGASASGDPIAAFLGMLAFGAGTSPALVAVAFGGSWLLPKLGIDVRRIAPYIALGNAVFLSAIAVHMALKS